MSKVLGIISCNYQFSKLYELNQNRPTAAIPVGGRYTIIDFSLSNLVNAGVKSVGIIMPVDYRPILDHIRSGKSWGLDRKSGGLFILPGENNWVYRNNKFSRRDLKNNVDFLNIEKVEYVILTSSNSIINIDFREVLDFHKENEADITLVYKRESREKYDGLAHILDVDSNGDVTDICKVAEVEARKCNAFTEQIIIRRDLLLELIFDPVEEDKVSLIEMIKDKTPYLKVKGYEFKGFYASVFSKESYYDVNMEIMKPEVTKELFLRKNKIVTKTRDNPPTKYTKEASVKGSLISSGCQISGTIENSLIFRGVKVSKGAIIRNSIVMHECEIGEDVVLENVILDKSVKISKGIEIVGNEASPTFIPKFKSL